MIQIFGKTEKGPVRLTNEDTFRVTEVMPEAYLIVVCDGMGGENGGDVASYLAAERITELVRENYRKDMSSNSIRDMLISAVSAANTMVHMRATEDIGLQGMGTTVVASFLVGGIAHIVSAGDSRAYLVGEDAISQITKDHTMVQVYLEQGKITEDEAKHHPQKHLVTRAVGVDEDIDVDYAEFVLRDTLTLLACSDGLTNYVEEMRILEIIQEESLEQATNHLIEEALTMGGADNITVVLARMRA